ncbi:MAG: hypothetical protein K4305_11000, partial [Chlorobium sp.]|uniref:hypothetical protein n=1 Tax=Chlorobium sp. TaxID=1095 RepID=UPI002F40E2D8
LAQIIGVSAPGYFFLLLSHPAISLSGKKRKSAVPADWERIFTDGKIVGCELWDGRGRVFAHGLTRIGTD